MSARPISTAINQKPPDEVSDEDSESSSRHQSSVEDELRRTIMNDKTVRSFSTSGNLDRDAEMVEVLMKRKR